MTSKPFPAILELLVSVSYESLRASIRSLKTKYEQVRHRRNKSTYNLFFKRQISMAKKLYVGGISYGSNDDALREYFSQAGNVVSATIIMDRMTGRSKGFGFVEMSTDEEAANAIAMLNGKELDGRALSISEARPMTERPPRREGNGGGYNRGGDRGGNSRW